MNADNLMTLLRARYAAPAWAFFPEFRESTGGAVRSLDALAVALYESKGLRVHGFEVKVSRSDLQRELADPSKAEAVAKFCDLFWLVVPHGVVGDVEVPETWGILEPTKDGTALRAIRAATALRGLPKGDVRGFVASLARRSERAEGISKEQHEHALKMARIEANEQGYERGFKEGARKQDRDMTKLDLENLRAHVKGFEEASGITIDWNHRRVGEAVKRVLAGDAAMVAVEHWAQRHGPELRALAARVEQLLVPVAEPEPRVGCGTLTSGPGVDHGFVVACGRKAYGVLVLCDACKATPVPPNIARKAVDAAVPPT